MNIILGEASNSVCLNPAAMCFKCVDKINDYDEAYEKMQKIEHEFKSMIGVDMTMKSADPDVCAKDNNTLTDDVTTDANGMAGEVMAANQNAGDTVLVSSDEAVNNNEPLELPQNDHNVSILEQKPVDEPAAKKILCEKKKSEYHCEECKKSFRSKRGLVVMRKSRHHGIRKLLLIYSFFVEPIFEIDARFQQSYEFQTIRMLNLSQILSSQAPVGGKWLDSNGFSELIIHSSSDARGFRMLYKKEIEMFRLRKKIFLTKHSEGKVRAACVEFPS